MSPSWLPDVRECAGKAVLCIVGVLQEVHGVSTTPVTHRLHNARTFHPAAIALSGLGEGLRAVSAETKERDPYPGGSAPVTFAEREAEARRLK